MSDYFKPNPHTREIFLEYGQKTLYKKGQLLVRREEANPWIFFVETGFVKMMFTNKTTGEERILGFGTPGTATNPSGNFYTLPQFEIEFEAHTDCEIWRMTLAQFMDILGEDDVLFSEWYQRVLENQGLLVEKLLNVSERDPFLRIVAWIRLMMKFHSTKQSDGSYIIEVPFTQEQIASFIGLSRESTNHAFAELKKRGLVETKNKKIRVLDPVHLGEIHSSDS